MIAHALLWVYIIVTAFTLLAFIAILLNVWDRVRDDAAFIKNRFAGERRKNVLSLIGGLFLLCGVPILHLMSFYVLVTNCNLIADEVERRLFDDDD